ncbi:MAG: hypothetical protein VB086_03450 [Clostridiaceae bacterium]|nr:hypothetical protein [Clostridiaceae bacterium]
MTFEEFLAFRDVKIKNPGHERIVRLFFPYLGSVSGDDRRLPNLIGRLLGSDLSSARAETGCFNGIPDGAESPYPNVDLFMRFDNGVRVYVYGSASDRERRVLKANEYVLFVLRDDLCGGRIKREAGRHIWLI